ncbi:tyrosine-type recombinase/integrase [Nocardia uniformis]|uniref:Tyrosine-type recombinase/integrase n=1 Tax=Nocardia uniformis TaxID=53432 RepID=A0A849BUZ7_9NOCA|nr:tyrosine-type recombinase/integrase [Nocardia uniformis]
MLGTGTRPGEALALRRCAIDRTATSWRATICGTIVRVDGKLFRQPWTKTEAGYRTVHLPDFTISTLQELAATKWDADDERLIFTNRKGNPRELQNFGRVWRQARGTEFAWVTPATFRKVVATIITEATESARRAVSLGTCPGRRSPSSTMSTGLLWHRTAHRSWTVLSAESVSYPYRGVDFSRKPRCFHRG